VLVLFPTGLNAHKDAVANNTLPDLTEVVVSSLKSKFGLSDYAEAEGFKASGSSLKIDEFLVDGNGYKDAQMVDFSDGVPAGWQKLSGGNADKDDTFVRKNSGNFILVRHMSGPEDNRYVAFSAVAVIKKDEDSVKDMFVWTDWTQTEGEWKPRKQGKFNNELSNSSFDEPFKLSKDDLCKKYFVPYVLEISYPADREWAERTKKVFRFEVYNEAYCAEPANQGDSNQ
jgi:hypothetical protein